MVLLGTVIYGIRKVLAARFRAAGTAHRFFWVALTVAFEFLFFISSQGILAGIADQLRSAEWPHLGAAAVMDRYRSNVFYRWINPSV